MRKKKVGVSDLYTARDGYDPGKTDRELIPEKAILASGGKAKPQHSRLLQNKGKSSEGVLSKSNADLSVIT